MTDTASFSNIMQQQRAGANGFTTPDAHSEFVDNAHDSGSAHFWAAVVRVAGSTKGYIVTWDLGHGARDIRVLYGIGPNVCRKSGAGMRGVKNYGHIAAIGYFNPDRVTHISRAVGAARAGTLVFDLGALYAAFDAAAPAVNYSQIDTTVLPALLRHNPDCGLTDETRELVQAVLAAASPAETLVPLREHLERILRNEVPSFMTTIMEYDNLPATKIAELVDAHRAFRMDYYLALATGGRSIEFLSDRPEECINATAENAINPMGLPDWPRITGSIETRVTAAAVTHMKITVTHAADTAVFWLTYVNGHQPTYYDGRKPRGPGLIRDEPGTWAAATPIGTGIAYECSVLSKAEEDRQKALVGSSIYKSVEAMRGVRLRYHDRDLGVPVFNNQPKQWGKKRNVGGLRVTLTFCDPETAERLIGIQNKKNSANFESMHKGLQTVLNWKVGRIVIPHFSNYKVCRSVDGRGNSPGVTDWKFPWLCALMLNAKARDPTLAAAAPTLSVSSVSGDDSDDESASVSTAPSPAVGGAGAAAPAPVVMTPVAASMRAAPMSLRELATRFHDDINRLFNSNLDEVAENAPTGAFAGLPTLYSDFKKMVAILETSAGLTYT